MKLLLKKISVILITFMTLGMYIPPTYLDANAQREDVVAEKDSVDTEHSSEIENIEGELPSIDQVNYFEIISGRAKEQTVAKMGPRIADKVEKEFTSEVWPKMEEALKSISLEAGEETARYYAVSEELSSGYGEKIFNVYDVRNEKDIAKFHVRRENRPGEGYWFNFHYHLSVDGFEEHHTLGEIYWNKNTPPKWMA
ncbi:YpjP family protein [Sediminibacillus massiliensis]|uniref:YpjP family protein n=1 Tax=Sediminibacillus massiliensis TaxID=1926277 RepID=UPI000988777E|nr:YpjP family protein [Sediminibacillus massiliensis]